MNRKDFSFRPKLVSMGIIYALMACASTSVVAQFSTLHSFTQLAGGEQPIGGLIADSAGSLYGAALFGGSGGNGTIFELSPPDELGRPWTETVLYNLPIDGTSGSDPRGGLIFDGAGNLYGTTSSGGDGANHGTAFELMRPALPGGAWTLNTLHSFQGGTTDGAFPMGSLTFDLAGNLYGATFEGGECDDGTIFELSPPASQGASWTETVLYSFHRVCNGKFGKDGAGPVGSLLFAGGSLYGVTSNGGGPQNAGTVFQLVPPATGQTIWREKLLYSFTTGSPGANPFAGLTLLGGKLYGTALFGGNTAVCSNNRPRGCGIVFELAPPTAQKEVWTEVVLYAFSGTDGSEPSSPVIFDPSGNLYSTTNSGGIGSCNDTYLPGCGTVFKLAKATVQGGPWTQSILHYFTGDPKSDGGSGLSGLIFGRGQKLYGTTGSFSVGEVGTVFSVTP